MNQYKIKDEPVNDGWKTARVIADWLLGQDQVFAHEAIDRAERLHYERHENRDGRLPSADRDTQHSRSTGTDKIGVGSQTGHVNSLGESMGSPERLSDSQESIGSRLHAAAEMEEGEAEKGEGGVVESQHSVSYLDSPATALDFIYGQWERKCWGWTRCVFHSNEVIVYELKTLEGWQCSRHMHQSRRNRFIVNSGMVGIEEWSSDEMVVQRTILHPGCIYDVSPLQWHRFQSFESSSMTEVYFRKDGGGVNVSDIVRDKNNLGSRIPPLTSS